MDFESAMQKFAEAWAEAKARSANSNIAEEVPPGDDHENKEEERDDDRKKDDEEKSLKVAKEDAAVDDKVRTVSSGPFQPPSWLPAPIAISPRHRQNISLRPLLSSIALRFVAFTASPRKYSYQCLHNIFHSFKKRL